jgi:hypothetical protein
MAAQLMPQLNFQEIKAQKIILKGFLNYQTKLTAIKYDKMLAHEYFWLIKCAQA